MVLVLTLTLPQKFHHKTSTKLLPADKYSILGKLTFISALTPHFSKKKLF